MLNLFLNSLSNKISVLRYDNFGGKCLRLFLAARANETGYLIIFNETQELVLYIDYSRVFGFLVFIAIISNKNSDISFMARYTQNIQFLYINGKAYKEYIHWMHKHEKLIQNNISCVLDKEVLKNFQILFGFPISHVSFVKILFYGIFSLF